MATIGNGFIPMILMIFPLILLLLLTFFSFDTCTGLQCYYGPSRVWIKEGAGNCDPDEKSCNVITCQDDYGTSLIRGCTRPKYEIYRNKTKDFLEIYEYCGIDSHPINVRFCDTDLCNKASSIKYAGFLVLHTLLTIGLGAMMVADGMLI